MQIFSQTPCTIMIDPIGNAKQAGREILDTFERSVTMQCAQKLKEELSKILPNIRVIITRTPGESVEPLQNATFANRLDVHFYLAIGFYHEPNIPAHVTLFYYLEQPTDRWHQYNPLMLYHISQAHLPHINITQQIAKTFTQCLSQPSLSNIFVLRGAFGIPCMPLYGIKSPALYLEAGLRNPHDWHHLIHPLIECIESIAA